MGSDRATGGGNTVAVAEPLPRGTGWTEPDFTIEDTDERTRLPKSGSIVLAVFGIALLLSAIGAGALIMAKPAQPSRPPGPAMPISGALALRPDLVLHATWPFRANGGFAEATEGSGSVATADFDPTRLANPAAGSESTTLGAVTEFYRRAQHSPDTLAELVTPELGQAAELRQAWRDTETVRVLELRVLPDRSVRARVEATYDDGRRVRLDQRLRVSTGPLPLIVGAELTSARQFPPG